MTIKNMLLGSLVVAGLGFLGCSGNSFMDDVREFDAELKRNRKQYLAREINAELASASSDVREKFEKYCNSLSKHEKNCSGDCGAWCDGGKAPLIHLYRLKAEDTLAYRKLKALRSRQPEIRKHMLNHDSICKKSESRFHNEDCEKADELRKIVERESDKEGILVKEAFSTDSYKKWEQSWREQ